MWIEFESLPDDARIWIFTIQGEIDERTIIFLSNELKSFIHDWTSHQLTLKASAKISEGRFIILGLDQQQAGASGCSIDKLMRFIQKLELDTGLNLLLKNKIAIKGTKGIELIQFQDIKHLKMDGVLSNDIKYYDTMVDTKQVLDTNWLKSLDEGWLAKKLNPMV